MKASKLIIPVLGAVFVAGLSACSSDTREGTGTASLLASQACISCHTSKLSPVTGNAIVTEWLASAHNTRNGAACPDCHAVNGHPSSGLIPSIPGTDSVCLGCHTAVTMKTYAAHFGTISTASYLGRPDALFVDSNPVTSPANAFGCRGCHNPHDTTSLINVNKQWATSKHAGIADLPFNGDPDFLKNTTCNRCHTSTGFRYYVTNGQNPITTAVLGKFSSSLKNNSVKEVVGCSTCHNTYNWTRLTSNAAFVNFSVPYVRAANVSKRYPGILTAGAVNSDVGDSKLCIPCHGGRYSALTLSSGKQRTDPHYFPSAGVMYMKIGYIDFVPQSTVLPAVAAVTGPTPTGAIPATTYGRTLVSSEDIGTGTTTGGVTSTHRKLGTKAINGNAPFVPGFLDSGGPCVTCHLAGGHSFKITGDSYNKVCINCHTSERGLPLNAENFLTAFVDENGEQMNSAFLLGVKLLETRYNITVRADSAGTPVNLDDPEISTLRKFSDPTQSADFTKNAAGATLSAAEENNLRGAAFNIMIGFKENASFVHGRTYMRRLLYDAIDFLDDGIINMSVGATALSPLGQTVLDSAGNVAFRKGTKAFVTDTSGPLDPGTSSSMTYIIGFDRTTGSWTPALRERP